MTGELPPHIGPVVFAGYGCSHDIGQGLCGEPAVQHFAWDEDAENGLACERHWPIALRLGPIDWHPVRTSCAARPSTWIWSGETNQGHCEYDAHPDLTESEELELLATRPNGARP